MGCISKRLLAALGVSLAVHAGFVFAPTKTSVTATPVHMEFSKRPDIPREVLHEEPVQPEPEERRPQVDVQALKDDRQRFVERTLESVKRGERIPLSDFLIESQLLDWNIKAAENGEPLIELGGMRAEYRRLLEKAAEHLREEEDRYKALHQFLHARVLSTYYGGSDSVIDVLKTNWYNCLSSTEMSCAMQEDVLGIRPEVVILGDHVRSFHGGRSIENTEPDWNAAVMPYDHCGIVTSGDVFISAYLLGHGVPEEEIPRRLMRPYRQGKEGGRNCIHATGEIPEFNGVGGLMLPQTADFSGMDVPAYPMPNRGFLGSTKTEDIVKMAKVFLAAYRLSNPDERMEGVADELALQNGIVSDAVSVPNGVRWDEIFRVYSAGSMMHPALFSDWPERLRRYLSFQLIPAYMVSILAEAAARSGDQQATWFTRENICNENPRMIDHGNVGLLQWRDYHPFGTCRQLDELLRNRYAIEQDTGTRGQILRQLGILRLPRNFDFFLAILNSATDESTEFAAAQALILSDRERGCAIVRQRLFNRREEVEFDFLRFELSYDCADSEILWSSISRQSEALKLIAIIDFITDGKSITPDQYELLESLERRRSDVDHYVKMVLGRIFYEYGRVEEGWDFFRRGFQESQARSLAQQEERCQFPYGIPLEFLPMLETVMSDSKCALEVAMSLEATPHAIFPVAAVEPLRRLVFDEDEKLEKRVHSAFLLLKHGIDPLERD